MDHHKFRVGQIVKLASPGVSGVQALLAYKILTRLPRDGSGYAYRIKTITEPFDHVARESEIDCFSAQQPARGEDSSGAVLRFAPLGSFGLETAN